MQAPMTGHTPDTSLLEFHGGEQPGDSEIPYGVHGNDLVESSGFGSGGAVGGVRHGGDNE